ncbi:MAG TPA: hypothetical protein VFA98_08360 [Thermoanaerobaculia bacterium]|nr:hypothetical protein [Thermoanaerobaculia bacterium]
MKRLGVFLASCLLALACGKKGDPEPPLPRGPNAIKNLTVEQEGDDAVLTFAFPDRLQNGAPLTDLFEIDVLRVVSPAPGLGTPRPAGPGTSRPVSGITGSAPINLPGGTQRRTATNVRVAEEQFYESARTVAKLSLSSIAELTRGASVVYRDPLSPLFEKEGSGPPKPLAYAVISVRRDGQRSPLSNIVTLAPDVAPAAPTLLFAYPQEGSICLEWTAPESDVLGRPVQIGGYEIYRRILPREEFETPLNHTVDPGLSYVDRTAPYDASLVYTVRAVLAKNPKVEGLPAEELPVVYRDVYPPPPPAKLDVLSEGNRVRLVWTPVDAADLAGYLVFRAAGDGALAPLNRTPLTDPFFTDEGLAPGTRYRYAVRAVDRVGNLSPPSPEAVAEPY